MCQKRFSFVITIPLLKSAIFRRAVRFGHGNSLGSVRITPSDTNDIMAAPEKLKNALLAMCQETIPEDGAEAILIGGGLLGGPCNRRGCNRSSDRVVSFQEVSGWPVDTWSPHICKGVPIGESTPMPPSAI